jgi:hypothetical protein
MVLNGPRGPDLGNGSKDPNLVEETERPKPMGTQRIDHRMPGVPEVPFRVPFRGLLAAADVAARSAEPESPPRRAVGHAGLAGEQRGNRSRCAPRPGEVLAPELPLDRLQRPTDETHVCAFGGRRKEPWLVAATRGGRSHGPSSPGALTLVAHRFSLGRAAPGNGRPGNRCTAARDRPRENASTSVGAYDSRLLRLQESFRW